jgi:C4-dicarboxylate transporter DctM subunit
MSQTVVGLIGCVIVIVLILMGTHLGLTLLIAGFIGFALIGGWNAALGNLAIIPFNKMTDYNFTVLAMFFLMAAFVSQSGIGKEAYESARAWVGQFKGGLAMATVGGWSVCCRSRFQSGRFDCHGQGGLSGDEKGGV